MLNAHNILILVILLIIYTECEAGNNSEVSYITVYGKVITGTPQATTTTVSYKECLNLCIASPLCVLAYGNTICQLYNYGNIESVSQESDITSGPEDIVSFRINQDSNTCPSKPAVNPPTFDNYQATGKIVTNTTLYFYRITLTDGIWNYETRAQSSNISCNGTFQIIERKFGICCARFIAREWEGTTCHDYYAESRSSGMENQAEFDLAHVVVYVNDSNYQPFTKVYSNATMTSGCLTTGNCQDIWNDPDVTLPNNAMHWLPGYPNNDGDCIGLILNLTTGSFGFYNFVCNDGLDGATYCAYFPNVIS